MFMGNAKSILSPYSFALCFYCSLRRTHTARYLLLLNQVRDPLTHIYMDVCLYVCLCVYNKYMKFRRGNSFCFISKRYTCLCICICICKCICSLCLQQYVCMCVAVRLYVNWSVCASSKIKNGCSICKYKMLKIQKKSFLKKLFHTMSCCCFYIFSCSLVVFNLFLSPI